MTLVLRDSLGGNCKTRMVATVSCEEPDLDVNYGKYKLGIHIYM